MSTTNDHELTTARIAQYLDHLREKERGERTVRRYEKSILAFYDSLPPDKIVTKQEAIQWKAALAERCAPSTVNVMLAALNGIFAFQGWHDCRVKPLKRQRRVFRERDRELTRTEYLRLLEAAGRRGSRRLYCLMETLCSTGMRVSELRFVTVESLAAGRVCVNCKGKLRTILLTKRLRRALREYCRSRGIRSGPVFVTRTGKHLDRSNIWRDLRALSRYAGVDARKVFPHNFRHLFAVMFYRLEKDMAKLADLLGHASVETTRIYIMESSAEHERQLERLQLVL